MKVLKFGGSVLRNDSDFERMAEIIWNRRNEPTLVVVSAIGSMTRDLQRSCAQARLSVPDEAPQNANDFFDTFELLYKSLLITESSLDAMRGIVDTLRQQLHNYLRGIAITQQLTPRILDSVLAIGEELTLDLCVLYLQQKAMLPQRCDARDVIVSDSHFGAAHPLRRETYHKVASELLPRLEGGGLVIMQGFVARSQDGWTTTMGRESSNLSAALMAQMLHADELLVYTDVAGIRSADPTLVPGSRLIPQLNYTQAHILAVNGVKLLYPTMIEPLRSAGIPLTIRDVRRPDSEHTVVSANSPLHVLKTIICAQQVSLVRYSMRSFKAAEQLTTHLEKTFEAHEGVLLRTQSASSLSIVLAAGMADRLQGDIPDDCTMGISDGLALITAFNADEAIRQYMNSATKNSREIVDIVASDLGEFDQCSHLLCAMNQATSVVQAIHTLL